MANDQMSFCCVAAAIRIVIAVAVVVVATPLPAFYLTFFCLYFPACTDLAHCATRWALVFPWLELQEQSFMPESCQAFKAGEMQSFHKEGEIEREREGETV